MDIEHTVMVERPLAQLWQLVSDVEVVARCLPGVVLDGENDDGSYRGSIEVSFGPTKANFSGRATIESAPTPPEITITASGSDDQGRTRAAARLIVTAKEAGSSTQLEVSGSVDVIGPLASFAETGGRYIATGLLEQFAECLGKSGSSEKAGRKESRLSLGLIIKHAIVDLYRRIWTRLKFRRR